MAQTLAEKFQFECRAELAQMALDSVKPPADPTPFNTSWYLCCKVNSHSIAALEFYLLGLVQEARSTAARLPTFAAEAFLGSWRAAFVSDSGLGAGHEALRRLVGMMGEFQGCILWGAVLGEWEFLRKIAEYPAEDDAIGSGLDEIDLHQFLALSSLLLDSQSNLKKHLQHLTTEGGERGKLIATVIRSLSKRDETETNGALHKYLAYFKKREFPKRNIFKKVSVLGTFAWHYGRQTGLEIEVDPKFVDHIVRLDWTNRCPAGLV
jgi:hypothetical protein